MAVNQTALYGYGVKTRIPSTLYTSSKPQTHLTHKTFAFLCLSAGYCRRPARLFLKPTKEVEEEEEFLKKQKTKSTSADHMAPILGECSVRSWARLH